MPRHRLRCLVLLLAVGCGDDMTGDGGLDASGRDSGRASPDASREDGGGDDAGPLDAGPMGADAGPALAPSEVALLFTDLTSGPSTGGPDDSGAFVTLFGAGFGATAGQVELAGAPVARVVSWGTDPISGLDMIVVQPGAGAASGDLVVIDAAGNRSNGLAFTIDEARRIRVVDGDADLGAALSEIASDNQRDILYLRAGAYTGEHGDTGWGDDWVNLGPAWRGIAIIAHPGEVVTTGAGAGQGGIRTGNASGPTHDLTVAKLRVVGTDWCLRPAGPIDRPDDNLRVVGIDCTTTYTGNTLTGALAGGGDGGRFLGNFIHDNGGSVVENQNHAVYLQENYIGGPRTPPTNWVVAYNRFIDNRMGHVIQLHGDDARLDGANIHIHSNVIQRGERGDARGIVADNVGAADVYIYNNVIDGTGQDFTGAVTNLGPANLFVFHNTIVGYGAGGNDTSALQINFTTTGTITARNNVLVSPAGIAYALTTNGSSDAQLTLDSNCYFGNGAGPARDANAVNGDPRLRDVASSWGARDYRLGGGSPCVDASRGDTSAVPIPMDRDGRPRPVAAERDIGAHESDG